MVLHEAVEEGFVGVLNITQVDVFIDFGFKALILDRARSACSSMVSTTSGSRPSRLKLLRSSMLKALPLFRRGTPVKPDRRKEYKGNDVFQFVVHVTHSF